MAKKKSDGAGSSEAGKKPKKSKIPPMTVAAFTATARQQLFSSTKKSVGAVASFAAGGLHMPLAMQYLLDVRAYPLGVVIQITGDRGCRKSTLLYHIGSWFTGRGGLADITTTEGKLSPMLLESVLGYEDEFAARGLLYPVRTRQATSMQEWQVGILDAMSNYNRMMDDGYIDSDGVKRPGGMYVPVYFGLDSLVAQLTDQQAKAVEEKGGSDRGYATHVKAISQWLSTVQAKLTNRPYSLTLINHCTIVRPTEYQIDITPKGGSKTAYESTYIMYLDRSKPESLRSGDPRFAPESKLTAVRSRLLKSSLGDETRRITWYIRDDFEYDLACGIDGATRQRTSFLWGRALTELVMGKMYAGHESLMGESADSAALRADYRTILSEHVPFKAPIKADTYMCEKYSDEPMDGETLGNFLQRDKDFVSSFYKAFAIKPYSIWPYGEDYNTFINRAKTQSFAQRVAIPDFSEQESDDDDENIIDTEIVK